MATKLIESKDDKENILKIKMSDMKNGQVAIDEYGNAVIHIDHDGDVVNLILDNDSSADSYAGACDNYVTIMPKGKSVTVKFYNKQG